MNTQENRQISEAIRSQQTQEEDKNLIVEELDLDSVTEKMYMDMSRDCKNRIILKNKIIHDLQKKIIIIFSLLERYMDEGDEVFLEDAKMILDKSLIENIGIQEID